MMNITSAIIKEVDAFNHNLILLTETLDELRLSNSKLLIVIEDSSDCKATLPGKLALSGVETLLIDSGRHFSNNESPVDLSGKLNSPKCTYIIDKANLCVQHIMERELINHLNGGGIAIIFTDFLNDIHLDFFKCAVFRLSNNSLFRIR